MAITLFYDYAVFSMLRSEDWEDTGIKYKEKNKNSHCSGTSWKITSINIFISFSVHIYV